MYFGIIFMLILKLDNNNLTRPVYKVGDYPRQMVRDMIENEQWFQIVSDPTYLNIIPVIQNRISIRLKLYDNIKGD